MMGYFDELLNKISARDLVGTALYASMADARRMSDTLQHNLLDFAIQRLDVDITQILLSAGLNVNAVSLNGMSNLMKAVSRGHTELVEVLLINGADPNFYAPHQGTALHLAAQQGYVDILKLLIKYGARHDTEDDNGYTAHTWAHFQDELAAAEYLASLDGSKLQ